MLASLLYFGAGIGIAILYLFVPKKTKKAEEHLSKEDLPYTVGMILLDIAAPILMMFGLSSAAAANVSLLNNFEIVATSVIALTVFKEAISKRLWLAVSLITLSSAMLSFEDLSSLQFSCGSVFVILACICWGFENNCTRQMAGKSTYEIVILKGIFSGLGSLIVAFAAGNQFPDAVWIIYALMLGFAAYGLSIFVYIRAQKELGAAKTSAYYAAAPFISALLSMLVLHEWPTASFAAASVIMIAGTAEAVMDTMGKNSRHLHTHTIMHMHKK
jgi:drug/metabolite transporter (DMT)-like permease